MLTVVTAIAGHVVSSLPHDRKYRSYPLPFLCKKPCVWLDGIHSQPIRVCIEKTTYSTVVFRITRSIWWNPLCRYPREGLSAPAWLSFLFRTNRLPQQHGCPAPSALCFHPGYSFRSQTTPPAFKLSRLVYVRISICTHQGVAFVFLPTPPIRRNTLRESKQIRWIVRRLHFPQSRKIFAIIRFRPVSNKPIRPIHIVTRRIGR